MKRAVRAYPEKDLQTEPRHGEEPIATKPSSFSCRAKAGLLRPMETLRVSLGLAMTTQRVSCIKCAKAHENSPETGAVSSSFSCPSRGVTRTLRANLSPQVMGGI